MQYEEKGKTQDMPHNIIIEGRARMSISGVTDVENFDDLSITLYTDYGLLCVTGRGLHIERLSLDTGELAIEGTIDGIAYSEDTERGGFWSRLFR